jgi:hypothetical protein
MNRSWIAVLTGLALLAQTSSMAWATSHFAAPAEPVAAESAMPCHGDDPTDDAGTGSMPCECCNGGCIFACGGAPLPAVALAGPADAPDHVFPATPVPAPLDSHTDSPFRPPAA